MARASRATAPRRSMRSPTITRAKAMGDYSKVEIDGHLMIVTINRPEVYNALHPIANQELSDIFDRFHEDPELWVAIVTGAGDKAFSAGNDLKYSAEYRKKTGKAPEQPPR